MSLLINCKDLKKIFSIEPLFENLDVSIFERDKLGIVGPNGSGKSTLLKIMAGLESCDEGLVTARTGLKVTYLAQQNELPLEKTVQTILVEANKSFTKDRSAEALQKAQVLMSLHGFDDPEIEAAQLSGGWQKRLSILCALMQEPDVMLLDEPTNHLDFDGILWLENLLKNASFAWVLISHDRSFLNNTTKRILELNSLYEKGSFVCQGNYEDFLVLKEQYIADLESYSQSLENKVKREEEWLQRGPKARSTKSKYRIDKAGALQQELQWVMRRQREKQTRMSFSSSERKTKKLLELKNASLSFGEKVIFKDFTFEFQAPSVVGILGGNGAGKSSFLQVLTDKLSLTSGSLIKAGELKIAYFDQKREALNPKETLKQALCPYGDHVIFQKRSVHINSYAAQFGFSYAQLSTTLGKLSGGEQARVLIAQLMLNLADVLILDEPTNDLDIPTLEILEQSLQEFQGLVLVVSHDRYFLKQICKNYLGFVGDGKLQNFSDFTQWQKATLPDDDSANKKQQKQSDKQSSPGQKGKKLSFNQQRELDTMESNVEKLEAELEVMREKSATLANHQELTDSYQQIEKKQEQLDDLYIRWGELEALRS